MNLVKFSIDNPVTVVVGVLLVVLFGVVSFRQIPVQLSPNVEQPIITINTAWPGASPYEVERDVVYEQERRLKGLLGLDHMESIARDNRGRVVLTFDIGVDIDAAMLRVANKLNEVPFYPENVEQPVLTAAGSDQSPVIWLALRTLPENSRNVYTYYSFFDNEVRQFLERVPGVADLNLGGGVTSELQVLVDMQQLAARGITVEQLINALRGENRNISAGHLDVGRNELRVRTVGEFQTEQDILTVAVLADGERMVTVGDIARVAWGHERNHTPVFSDHALGISIGVIPEPGANILDLTDAVEQTVAGLNSGLLEQAGLHLHLLNEQRPYIRGAIRLVQQSIVLGGVLAVFVLLLFLRSFAPTLVVATAIPISVIGAFSFMYLLGSTLNVVSLAGIAFAVGMLVDSAIVVLENIDRHHRTGKTAFTAALEGTREVWGAVLASSLTTIAVFLPVIFLEDEAGQLFRDIAVAVTCAVLLSLLGAVTLIPAMSSRVLHLMHGKEEPGARRRIAAPLLVRAGSGLREACMRLVRLVLHNGVTRAATITLLVFGAFATVYQLMPKAEYLPQGNRDLIISTLIPPPGLSFAEREAIGRELFAFFAPYYEPGHEGYPGIRSIFFTGRQEYMRLGIVSADQQRTRELLPLCREAINRLPGVFGTTSQASIFPGGIGQSRAVTVNLGGENIERLVETAAVMMEHILDAIPDSQVRPRPTLELLYPEVALVPDRERLRSIGMSTQQLGVSLDVLNHGRKIGDFKQEGGHTYDLVLKADGDALNTPEALFQSLIVTRDGRSVPVSSVARLEERTGLTEIRRYEQERTVYLLVTPPEAVTMQEAMEIIEGRVVPELTAAGHMDNIRVRMSGAADKLSETRQALQGNFILAVLISYLLMSALLGSFRYPLVILFTVPMAAAGGLIGLKLLNVFAGTYQMDILTMLGFIILVGVVVNNAILIVYQALNNIRFGGMPHKEAVLESVRTRLRPIYMSASTSIFGMLPLVVWTGPGSELYRGLGSVVLGGIAVSTIFTVFLVPSLLLFVIGGETPREPVASTPSRTCPLPESGSQARPEFADSITSRDG